MENCKVMPFDEYIERTLAIARGEYKVKPDEPKKFFESQETADRYYKSHNTESFAATM